MLLIFSFLLSFFSFIFLFFFGKFIGRNGLYYYVFFYSFVFLCVSYYNLLSYFFNPQTFIFLFFSWFNVSWLTVNFSVTFDSLSILMLFLVSNITVYVLVYSLYYMENDPFIIKFITYIYLFSFFMQLLITSNDLTLLLFGWEGVGICSFLLIGFWTTRLASAKASLKAIIFNRIGDLGFLIGLSLIFFFLKTTNIYVIYSVIPYYSNFFIFNSFFSLIDFVSIFFFLGVIGKSAQIGLHVWLLDAMEGPTPVSALIHAATMVTAGVFLLIRLSFILEFSFLIKFLISVIGILTALFGSYIALFQFDLKSIIAYSTCSQLGYMVSVIGCSGYYLSFFHLLNHGFFKALLFLLSGMIIHNFYDEQDIRKMGGLFYLFPLSFTLLNIGSLSLSGLPFLSGYYSKDFIIDHFYSLPIAYANIVYILSLLSAFFTLLYSIRLIYYLFLSKPNGFKPIYSKLYEYYPLYLIFVFFILSIYSIFLGFFFNKIFLSYSSNFFFDSIFIFSKLNSYSLFKEFFFLHNYNIWFSLKLIPFYLFFISLSLFYLFFKVFNEYIFSNFYFYYYNFSYSNFFFNYIYIEYFLKWFFKLAWYLFFIDKIFFEFYLINIISTYFISISSFITKISLNYKLNFFTYFIYAATIIIIIFFTYVF